jgi:hypothetical protein
VTSEAFALTRIDPVEACPELKVRIEGTGVRRAADRPGGVSGTLGRLAAMRRSVSRLSPPQSADSGEHDAAPQRRASWVRHRAPGCTSRPGPAGTLEQFLHRMARRRSTWRASPALEPQAVRGWSPTTGTPCDRAQRRGDSMRAAIVRARRSW